MKTLIAVVVIALLLVMPVFAQERVVVSPHVQSQFVSYSLNVRDDMLSIDWKKTLPGGDVEAFTPGKWRVKYSFVAGNSLSDTVTPTKSFIVGKTDFFVKPKDAKEKLRTVNLDWKFSPTHTLEGMIATRFYINPTAVAQWSQADVTASTLVDGKIITDSEAFRQTWWGVGAGVMYPMPNTNVELYGVAGPKFARINGNFKYYPRANLNIEAGFIYEYRDFGEARERYTAPYLGIAMEF